MATATATAMVLAMARHHLCLAMALARQQKAVLDLRAPSLRNQASPNVA